MTWLRATTPSPRARYSFTVNTDKHPELAELSALLWNLPPVPAERNLAILELLQAGLVARMNRVREQAIAPSAPPATGATSNKTAPPPRTRSTEAQQKSRPPNPPTPKPAAPAAPPPEAPSQTAATEGSFSSATSRFLHQFDDEAPNPPLVVT